MASLHKNRRTTLERIEKFISPEIFTDVNLFGRIYSCSQPIKDIEHWGFTGSWKEVTFHQVKQQTFSPVKIGDKFGPTWSTHWFKLTFKVPDTWSGKEVHLRWNSESEALIWDSKGHPIQGLSSGTNHQLRQEYIVSEKWEPCQTEFVFYVEMTASGMFGAGEGSMIAPPNADRSYTLKQADIAVFDRSLYELLIDLELLHDLAKELGTDERGFKALYAGNEAINLIQAGKNEKAKSITSQFFSEKNGVKAHTIACMGHCHIDSAWLWPYSETIRKCARSWSSVIGLMRKYPEFIFVCSQAQQFSWVKTHYPSLYEEIRHYVKEKRFIPVGATWVEMDGNIPSGESFVRQFLYGQKFFEEEFGLRCEEFWLPDTFDYSAQIPQIMKHVGLNWFLTQKISWSLRNKFPHHNFWWTGIDGSSILVHFPPADTYEANCKVAEALKTVRNLEDKGRVSSSMLLFGYGDGGGGPTETMLMCRQRLEDVDGCPRMKVITPSSFFSHLETEGNKLCRWTGELFLELHNGTYTSQTAMKKLNRQSEYKLRDAEFVLSLLLSMGCDVTTNMDEVHQAWKKVLLNQFHDVLPGSSIQVVHEEAQTLFNEALSSANNIINTGLHQIYKPSNQGHLLLLNSLPWTRKGVISVDKRIFQCCQISGIENIQEFNNQMLLYCEIPAMGSTIYIHKKEKSVRISKIGSEFHLENGIVSVRIDKFGRVTSFHLQDEHRDVFQKHSNSNYYGNQLLMFDDIPLYWDAWDTMDYHLETRRNLNCGDNSTVTPPQIIASGPLLAAVKWSMSIGEESSMSQIISLKVGDPYIEFDATVNWRENRKSLKVEFQVDITSPVATYEIQFGHLQRPTHVNTSWEEAKFEVCGHKWCDISEFGYGVSILNDSKFGWCVRGNSIVLSLLRSPKLPDPTCDMGEQTFRYALLPHRGSFQESGVIRRSYEFNISPMYICIDPKQTLRNDVSWISVDNPAIIVETLKPVESGERAIIMRCYEAFGGQATVNITLSLPTTQSVSVAPCDGLEDIVDEEIRLLTNTDGVVLPLCFRPFQIRSFIIKIN